MKQIFFPLLCKALWSGINSYYIYTIFKSEAKKKKEKRQNIINSRIISILMGSIYI